MQFLLYLKQAGTFKLTESQVFQFQKHPLAGFGGISIFLPPSPRRHRLHKKLAHRGWSKILTKMCRKSALRSECELKHLSHETWEVFLIVFVLSDLSSKLE
jgi:hypothetical protein